MSRVGRPDLVFLLALLLGNRAMGAPTANTTEASRADPFTEAPPPSATPPATGTEPKTALQLNDVVVMKDGRLLRGNITQLAPGQFVIIRMSTGELQKIALSNTSYAGPIINMPEVAPQAANQGSALTAQPAAPTEASSTTSGAADQQASTAATPVAPTALECQVSFEADEPGLTLHLRTTTSSGASDPTSVEGYRALCTAPCSVKLRPQAYRFGIGRGATIPMPTEQTVYVREPIRLVAKVHEFETLRSVGLVTLITSGALLFASAIAISSDCSSIDPTRCGTIGTFAIFPVLPLSVAGTVVGIVLGTKSDWAEVVQVPNPTPTPGTARLTVSSRF